MSIKPAEGVINGIIISVAIWAVLSVVYVVYKYVF